MKAIVVEVHAIRDGERVSASVIIERKRDDQWIREKVIDVASGMADSKRRLLLEDDQRVVIEGKSNVEYVFDKEQNASVPVLTDPEAEAKKQADEKAEALALAQREAAEREKALAEKVSEPKTNLGNPVKSEVPRPGTSTSTVTKPTPASPGFKDNRQGQMDSKGVRS